MPRTLPPKKGWGTSPEVVAERVCALTLFVDAVDRNPFLGADALWLHFLTPGGDMDKPDGALSPETSVGERRWRDARANLYGVGRDRMRDDATLHVALATLDTSDAQIKSLLTGCEALARAMDHFAEGAAALFAAEASWIDVRAHDERFDSVREEPSAPAVREPASLPRGLVPPGVAAAATGLAEHKEAVGRLPAEIAAMAREATDFQLAQAREFRALAKRYAAMDKEALAALKSKAEDRSALQRREADLRAFGGALVAFSLPVLAEERKFCVQSLTRELSPSLITHAKANEAAEAAVRSQRVPSVGAVTPSTLKKAPLGEANAGPEMSPMTTIKSFLDDAATKTAAPRAESPEGQVPVEAL